MTYFFLGVMNAQIQRQWPSCHELKISGSANMNFIYVGYKAVPVLNQAKQ